MTNLRLQKNAIVKNKFFKYAMSNLTIQSQYSCSIWLTSDLPVATTLFQLWVSLLWRHRLPLGHRTSLSTSLFQFQNHSDDFWAVQLIPILFSKGPRLALFHVLCWTRRKWRQKKNKWEWFGMDFSLFFLPRLSYSTYAVYGTYVASWKEIENWWLTLVGLIAEEFLPDRT